MITAVVFDVDDTLFDRNNASRDTREALCSPYIGEGQRARATRVWDRVNRELWEACSRGEVSVGEVLSLRWRTMFEMLGLDIAPCASIARQYLQTYPVQNRPVPGMPELVLALHKQSIPMAVLTNGIRSIQIEKLEAIGLLRYFDLIITDSECGYRKPDTRIFAHTASELKADPEHCVYLGNSLLEDIVPAREAGFWAIQVLSETSKAEQCREESAMSPGRLLNNFESFGVGIEKWR